MLHIHRKSSDPELGIGYKTDGNTFTGKAVQAQPIDLVAGSSKRAANPASVFVQSRGLAHK